MSFRLPPTLATAASLCTCIAPAADSAESKFSFDGFGTLGVIHSDYAKADFVTSGIAHPRGVGHSRSWGVDQDTKLGLQATVDFSSRLSGVVQVVSQLRYDNTFMPKLEWANLKYAITPELSVRAGRVVLPTFLTSDVQNVGYVNPWVRTPAEVLVQLPITNSDGVDLSYQFNVGDASNRVQLLYGNNQANVTGNINYENTGIRAITNTLDYAALTVHVAYQHMHYVYAASSEPNPPKESFELFEIATLYDPGGWYVAAEWFSTKDESIGHTAAWYAGGGYRFGDVTPYAFASRIEQTKIGESGVEPLFDQKTTGAGLRWDFMKNFAAKLQYERVEIGSLIVATSFTNLQPGFAIGDRAHVLSATVDFVW